MGKKKNHCLICNKECELQYCKAHKDPKIQEIHRKLKAKDNRNLGNSYIGYLKKAKLKVNKAY